jgi:hypothetical protein
MMTTITLDWDQADYVTRETLIQARQNIEDNGDYADVDVWDAMGEVIAYFSTPSQLEAMGERELSKEWTDILTQHTLDKLKNRSLKLYLDFA